MHSNVLRIAQLAIDQSTKPGLILAPTWKKLALTSSVKTSHFLLALAETIQAPIATAFVSENLYICPPGDKLVARLAANLMFHGEIGFDALHGVRTLSDIDSELAMIDLLSRQLKLVLKDETVVKIGAASGNLLKHAKKRSSLLNGECLDLADHAWIACAFSYGKDGVSSGAAVQGAAGAIFRAGGIENFVSAKEAVEVGMRANGAEVSEAEVWEFCDEVKFRQHRWYNEFLKVEG
jgi:hypothetical protein